MSSNANVPRTSSEVPGSEKQGSSVPLPSKDKRKESRNDRNARIAGSGLADKQGKPVTTPPAEPVQYKRVTPPPTAPVHEKSATLPSVVLVPLGRGAELRKEIDENLLIQKNVTRNNILKLEAREPLYGIDEPLNLINELRCEKEQFERLELRIKALEKEVDFQSRYEVELPVLAALRGDLAIAQGRPPTHSELLDLANKLYPQFFNQEPIMRIE